MNEKNDTLTIAIQQLIDYCNDHGAEHAKINFSTFDFPGFEIYLQVDKVKRKTVDSVFFPVKELTKAEMLQISDYGRFINNAICRIIENGKEV